MTPTEGASILELLVYQILWTVGPWLALGLGLVAILRGSRVFLAAVDKIEARAERTSARGRLAISLDLILHRMLTIVALLFSFTCVGIAGWMSGMLHEGIGPRVRELSSSIEQNPPQGATIDFIAAVCLVTLGVALVIVVLAYRTMRQRALGYEGALLPGERPPAVVWFSSRPLALRLGVAAFGALLCWGVLSHLVWGLMLIFPPPRSWLTLEAPGLLPVLAGVLLCIGPAVLAGMLWPAWRLEARRARLQQRFLDLNPQLRLKAMRRFAIAAGIMGAAIDLPLLFWIGARLFPELF